MRFLALFCAALGLSSSMAIACHPPVVLIGADGEATIYSPPRDVMTEMEARFGARAQPDAILFIDTRDRTGYWAPNAPTSYENVAAILGLSGEYRYSGPSECAPPNVPLDVPGRWIDSIELFADAPDTGLQPRSGLWQARLGATEMQGCPAAMQQAFPASPGALPPEMLAPRRLSFVAPFHPDQLEMTRSFQQGMASRVTWRSTGDTAWQAEIFPEVFAQIPAGEGAGSAMIWRLDVRSDSEIEHHVTVSIELPAIAAQALGSSGACQILARHQWIRIGD